MGILRGIRLPSDSRYLRNIPPSKADDPEFVAAYDQHTLLYDAFYDPETGVITAVGPAIKRRNVMFLKSAFIKIDGIYADIEFKQISPRTGELQIKSPNDNPLNLRLLHRDPPKTNAQMNIGRADHAKFENRNVIMAISKNNKLPWIRDWLKYYVKEHKADAVVLFDNGSDIYSLDELTETILSVPGIKAAEVLSADYPFGPKGTDRTSVNSKFFHLSMFHIANRRFLAKANAVLSVDIDELVTKPGSETIFEAVKSTPQGFLSIPGMWRYASKPQSPDHAIEHQDHTLMRIGRDAAMGPKWCINPRGSLAGKYWRVHGVAGAKHYYDHGYKFLHCRQISNGWDYDRAFEPDDKFETAPEAAFLQSAFKK
jgi:hypothetical protein